MVSIKVTAASVIIEVTITVPKDKLAATVKARLTSNLTSKTKEEQSKILGVTVETVAATAVKDLPPSVWIPGCFNPMGFVTASLQVTARVNQYSLDQMRVHIEVTDVYDIASVESQPADGAQIHGIFMENARWSCEEPTIADELEAAAGLPA